VSQQPAQWSDDRQWWWNGVEWRPASEFPGSSPPPPAVAAPRSAPSRRPLWIGAGLAGLVLVVVIVGIGQCGQPPADRFSVQGTGKYTSNVFALTGGSYRVSWQVQQTPMGANVPCSIQAELWSEAGYHQQSLIWGDTGSSVTAVSPVTVQMPAGRWYLEVDNSCSDSQSSISIERFA
jgi:hypothetical protein